MKYFHFARIALEDHLRNKVRIFTRFLVYLLMIWVQSKMWVLIYQSGHGPENISLVDMMWYIGVAQMVFFMSPRLVMVIDDDVRSGNIAYFLNRPLPYFWMRFAEGVGALSGNVVLYYVVGTLLIYLYIGVLPSGGWVDLSAALFLLFMASILHLMFQIGCGLTAFWTNDAVLVYNAYMKVFIVTGGLYAPLSLYPDFLGGEFLKFLPFGAMASDPVSLLLPHHTDGFFAVLLIQLFWIGAVGFGSMKLYRTCLKRVEVNGG